MNYMSDAVKSSEIEDVLSSIRRLVSEDSRAAGRADAPKDAGSDTVDEADIPNDEIVQEALVLTPALRVHDGGKDDDKAQTAQQSEEHGDGVASDPQEAEPDQTTLVLDAVADAVLTEALSDPEAKARDDEGSVHPVQPNDSHGEPEGEYAPEPEAENALRSEREDIAPTEGPETLEAKIAALETLIGKSDGTWDADESSETLVTRSDAEETLDWEDHQPEPEQDEVARTEEPAEAPVAPESEPEAVVEEPGATDGANETDLLQEPDTHVIDEEMLRDMVCDIVREELQGALGERITRNVRRLVRREIHRALASQELD